MQHQTFELGRARSYPTTAQERSENVHPSSSFNKTLKVGESDKLTLTACYTEGDSHFAPAPCRSQLSCTVIHIVSWEFLRVYSKMNMKYSAA